MMTVMVVGLMAMVLFGGAVLAFSFQGDDEQQQPSEQPAAQPQPAPTLVFFQPTGWSREVRQVSVDELVASIDDHLRKERLAAAAFARDPSARTLWLD